MDRALRARYESEAGAAAYAGKYDVSASRRWSSRRETRLVVRLATSLGAEGGLVLDVPCAAGRLVRPLLGVAKHVTAVDLSPAMVAVAGEALADEVRAGRATVARGSAESLPFADRSFDVVVCWRLLHHLVERRERVAVLSECARVARRGVVASFADRGTWKARFQAMRGRNRRCAKTTPAEMADEAREAGLAVVASRRLSSLFSLVAGAALVRAGATAA